MAQEGDCLTIADVIVSATMTKRKPLVVDEDMKTVSLLAY